MTAFYKSIARACKPVAWSLQG